MTVEQQVDALATSVDELKTAVVTKKVTLDATVVDAQSATEQAQAAKVNALSARDQAGAFKDAAYSAAQSAASAVAFQDLTALAAEKAVTALDVFIYDTSKDNDGGAWRHRCAGTSWFNEPLNTATRGARREFPAVAVIVAEASKVTIYDADDPALPMWMVFNSVFNSAITSVPLTSLAAVNGTVVLGTNQGTDITGSALVLNFLSEKIVSRRPIGSTQRGNYLGNILQRNSASGWDGSTDQSIVAQPVNDVAMTVLPDAPIDPATGLPVPTIAVATDGGVSVIKDDGTVVDIPTSGTATNWVGFNAHNQLVSKGNYDDRWVLREIPATDVANLEIGDATFVAKPYRQYGQSADYQRQVNFGDTYASDLGNLKNGLLLEYGAGSALGITSLVALTTSSYATGWLPGDIRGAFLADTDDTDLVGSGELVTNGTFDTDVSGWTVTANGTLTFSAGTGVLEQISGSNASAYQSFTTVVGTRYKAVATISGVSARILIGTSFASGNVAASGFGLTLTLDFVATATTTFISIQSAANIVGQQAVIDNVSVQLADADRSVNNNGLIVNGTITRAPVAAGAELVAYSGFSASNYLEQPYNPDLDFGTGDFCVMGWVRSAGGSGEEPIIDRSDNVGATGIYIYQGNNGNIFARVGNGTAVDFNLGASTAGVWRFIAVLRSAGVVSCYSNGELAASFSRAGSINTATNKATLFGRNFAGIGADITSLALLRIGATAPTADQIRRIYEDEKVLFQENAACTLYGASDAVTALAHDPDTGLLHVGTSAGRSVFKGLRRVANTTVPVGAAIAAAGGMVVEE